MVDVAVEKGGISGDAYGGEGCWGEGLGLAKEVGSGVVTVSLFLLDCFPPVISSRLTSSTLFKLQKSPSNEEECTNWWKGDSGSDIQDVSGLAGREDVLVRICSFDTLFITNSYTSLITNSSLFYFTG